MEQQQRQQQPPRGLGPVAGQRPRPQTGRSSDVPMAKRKNRKRPRSEPARSGHQHKPERGDSSSNNNNSNSNSNNNNNAGKKDDKEDLPLSHRKQTTDGNGVRDSGRTRTTTRDSENSEAAGSCSARHEYEHEYKYRGLCPEVSHRYRKLGDGRIGEGTYGVVYRARDKWRARDGEQTDIANKNKNENETTARTTENRTTTTVALKKCYAHHEASDGFPVTTLREIHALRICASHPNVVDLLEVSVSQPKEQQQGSSGSSVFLVFENCDCDLAKILDEHYDKHRFDREQRTKRDRGVRRGENDRNRQQRNNGYYYNSRSNAKSKHASSPFSLSQTRSLAAQLLSALEFCHRHRIVHRDVKPSNLLYNRSSGTLKLCDFGLSRTCTASLSSGGTYTDAEVHADTAMTPGVVSLWYRAPELLLPLAGRRGTKDPSGSDPASLPAAASKAFLGYSFPIDLWATGCVLAELLQGFPLLDGTSEVDQVARMVETIGDPPSRLYSWDSHSHPVRAPRRRGPGEGSSPPCLSLWDRFQDDLPPEGLSLLARLLEYDPANRWTAAQALGSPFLEAPRPVPIPRAGGCR